jgi:hypothetical protein
MLPSAAYGLSSVRNVRVEKHTLQQTAKQSDLTVGDESYSAIHAVAASCCTLGDGRWTDAER